MNNNMKIPQKVKNRFGLSSWNLTSGHISEENYNSERYIYHNFITALFTIDRTWKQLKCPSTDTWIKMWCVCIYIYTHTYTYINTHTHTHIYTMEYYTSIKKNEIMAFVATWMNLDIIILSEISQTEKCKYHMILLIYGL